MKAVQTESLANTLAWIQVCANLLSRLSLDTLILVAPEQSLGG